MTSAAVTAWPVAVVQVVADGGQILMIAGLPWKLTSAT
jgi:hypothetical protein